MGFLKVSPAGTSTELKFAGDVINKFADLFSGLNIAQTDSSNKPDIATETRFRDKMLRIFDNDRSNAFYFDTASANLGEDKKMKLPALAASEDEVLFKAHPAILSGKTISGSSNTITNIADAALSANIPRKDQANTFTEAQVTNKTAQSGAVEILHQWLISDVTSNLGHLYLWNIAHQDGVFSPLFEGQTNGGHPGLGFQPRCLPAGDIGSGALFEISASRSDLSPIVTRPIFSVGQRNAKDMMVMNVNGDISQKIRAQSGVAEILHEWNVSDVDPADGYIKLLNYVSTNGVFYPSLQFKSSVQAAARLTTYADEADDTSPTIPMITFDNFRVGDTAIVNRPLLKVRNNLVDVFEIGPSYIDLTNKTLRNAVIDANENTLLNLPSGGGGASTLDDLTDVTITNPQSGHVPTWNGNEWANAAPPGAGGGEANTITNIGTAGLGFYKQKAGINFELYKLNALSNRLSLALDSPNNKIDIDVVQANLTLSSIGGSVTSGQLPAVAVLTNQANAFGNFNQQFRWNTLVVQNSDNTFGAHLRYDGTESRGVHIPALDNAHTFVMESLAQILSNKTINASNNTITNIGNSAIAAHTTTKITTSNKALLNSSIAYKDESAWLTDAMVGVHTTTKITTLNKALLNAQIAYKDQANTFGLFSQIFRSGRLIVQNPADTFGYLFVGSAIAANRNITLPLLTANDTAVMQAFAQTLTNKTISGAANTITNLQASSLPDAVKHHPFVLVAHVQAAASGSNTTRHIGPFEAATWSSEGHANKITTPYKMVITRFRVGTESNNRTGTTVFTMRDDANAVPNTTITISAGQDTYADSGAISEIIAAGSEVRFRVVMNGTSGNLFYYIQAWGYYDLS